MLRRRHPLGGIVRRDPQDDLALFRLAGHDRRESGIAPFEDALSMIEPQAPLAFGLIHAVALRAMLREDRLDITLITERGSRPHALAGKEGKQQRGRKTSRHKAVSSRCHRKGRDVLRRSGSTRDCRNSLYPPTLKQAQKKCFFRRPRFSQELSRGGWVATGGLALPHLACEPPLSGGKTPSSISP